MTYEEGENKSQGQIITETLCSVGYMLRLPEPSLNVLPLMYR